MQANEIVLRTATESDVPKVLDFWAMYAENSARPSDSPEFLYRLLQHDEHALMVAIAGEALVGTVIAGWDGWRGYIYRLAVKRELKRSGIGAQLLSAAESRLRSLGAERVNAMVLEGNDEAHPFYSKLGYHRQEEWRRWIKLFGR